MEPSAASAPTTKTESWQACTEFVYSKQDYFQLWPSIAVRMGCLYLNCTVHYSALPFAATAIDGEAVVGVSVLAMSVIGRRSCSWAQLADSARSDSF